MRLMENVFFEKMVIIKSNKCIPNITWPNLPYISFPDSVLFGCQVSSKQCGQIGRILKALSNKFF